MQRRRRKSTDLSTSFLNWGFWKNDFAILLQGGIERGGGHLAAHRYSRRRGSARKRPGRLRVPRTEGRTVTTTASFQTWMISAPATRSTGPTCRTGTTSHFPNANGPSTIACHSIKPAYSLAKADRKIDHRAHKNVAHVAGKDWLGSLPERGPPSISAPKTTRRKSISALLPSPNTAASLRRSHPRWLARSAAARRRRHAL